MTLPVVDPPDDAPRDDRTVVGILLAAGESSRFDGGNKLLATIDGTPMVRRAAETLLQSRVSRVTVVLGHESDRVREALAGLDLDVVENPDYRTGQATSVRAGVAAAQGADAVLVALGDMPDVDPSSANALIDAYLAGRGDALAAAFEGERGNPVLFDERYVDDLASIQGDVGGRAILLDDGVLVETGDPGVLRDVDETADLER